MLAIGRIAVAAAQIDQSYSPMAPNVHPHLKYGFLDPRNGIS